ncbi:hypothetical protein H0Z60_15335 [Ectothiorhodospiraceae bacterium WFHF3C12]|nr:hypothetical protein [Ectothiorhodospiraceae bacterium WFHF3C12]
MSDSDQPVTQRIIVLVSDSCDSNAALEAAARMAGRLGAELQALFVEDVNLLRSAGLPFAREIGLTSATVRPMSPEAVEQQLRAQAERSRALLERIAQRMNIRSSFRVSRGNVESEALGSARPEDMLIICRADHRRRGGSRLSDREGRIVSAAHCTVMLVGERQPEENRAVLVLYANTARGRRSLALAASMARDAAQPLVLLLPPGSEAEHDRLAASAREWAQTHNLQLRFRELGHVDAAALLSALRQEEGDSLVIPRDAAALRDPHDRLLLDEVDTPVVVVP